MPTPQQIAAWRFELIAPFIDRSFDRTRRRAAMREITRLGVAWPPTALADPRTTPSGTRRFSRTTIFRWIKAYRRSGLKGLQPNPRSDAGTPRRKDAEPWIHRGIQLLYEQPDRSLAQIAAYLKIDFESYDLSRSSLHRHLRRHPAFAGIRSLRRRQRQGRLRGSFEAAYPHECWQLDGKGPFRVRMKGRAAVHVRVLTVIDDHSRAVLGAVVASEEDTEAVIRVFQKAAAGYGLPERMQFDRGSAFDCHAFRQGLANLGIHRNAVESRNPEAQGKIEAYHRTLGRWFIKELTVQEVVDLEHLQQLLDAMLAVLYNRHHHREIKTTPETRLAGKVSKRRVATQDLQRAFFADTTAMSHPKTGAVRLQNGMFRVPAAYAGKRCRFRFDLTDTRAVLVTKERGELELQIFAKQPLPPVKPPVPEKRGVGQLQKLVDLWRGRERPNAQPGFGLPEVFDEIGRILGRRIPSSEREATEVLGFYKQYGPLAKNDFALACERTRRALGSGRPLCAYLQDIERQIRSGQAKHRANDKECI